MAKLRLTFNSTVTEINPYQCPIATPEGSLEIPNDFVFAMTGYSPDLTFLNAERDRSGAGHAKAKN